MITGYNENGEPMFDNAREYCKYLEDKKKIEYNARNKFQIAMDIRNINYKLEKIFSNIFFGGLTDELLKDLIASKNEFDKEYELLMNREEKDNGN